jgi:hypothetical protein
LRCPSDKPPEIESDMNDTCEMWSLPWHALQRNLANGIGGDAIVHFAGSVRAVNVASPAANSWLGRARRQEAPLSRQARP